MADERAWNRTAEERVSGCVSCHTLQRIFKSGHDAAEFVQVMVRMAGYAPGSNPLKPQRRVGQIEPINPERFRKQAEWLSATKCGFAEPTPEPHVDPVARRGDLAERARARDGNTGGVEPI